MTHEVWCGAESRSAPRWALLSSLCPPLSLPLYSVTPLLQTSLPQVSPELPHWCSLFMTGGGQEVPSRLRLVGSCRESLGRGDAEERSSLGAGQLMSPVSPVTG